MINQKCPEADLRIENALTNELFGMYKITNNTEKPLKLEEAGGMREMLNIIISSNRSAYSKLVKVS